MASNTILTQDMLVGELLLQTRNQLTFSQHVYTGYAKYFRAVQNAKTSDTQRVPLPNKYRTKTGNVYDGVGMEERKVDITVDTHEHVGIDYTLEELTTDITMFTEKHLKPAGAALAQKVDYDGCGMYTGIYNQVGTPGTIPTKLKFVQDAAKRLDKEAITKMNRVAILSPDAYWGLLGGDMKGLFQPEIVGDLVKNGHLGRTGGIDFYMDQNIRAHTTGTYAGGTPLVKTTSSEGDSTLAIKDMGVGDVIKAGDRFTVAGIYGVNPHSGQVWEGNELRIFTVTAGDTADGSGDAEVTVSPKIYSSAALEDVLPYQTTNDLPTANDEITFLGTAATAYAQNFFMTPEAIALTMLPFEKPRSADKSVDWAQATDESFGLSITLLSFVDGTNYLEKTRADIFYGWDIIQPEYAVIGVGA